MGRFITPDPIGFADGPNLYAYVRNNPFLYHDPHGLFISDFFKGFASTGLQAIGFRLAVMGIGVFCPPAAVAINVAATCYSVYGLATLGVSVGSYVVNSAIDDGWQGTGSALYNIGHSFTEAGFLGGVVGSMASGKVKFNKSIRATHGGLILETTSKASSVFTKVYSQSKRAIVEEKATSINRGISFAGSKRFPLDYASYQKVRNEPTLINGLKYTGHALDRMQDRGIMPSVIENVLKTGNISPAKFSGGLEYYDILNKVKVIVGENNQIITVIPGRE